MAGCDSNKARRHAFWSSYIPPDGFEYRFRGESRGIQAPEYFEQSRILTNCDYNFWRSGEQHITLTSTCANDEEHPLPFTFKDGAWWITEAELVDFDDRNCEP